MHNIGAGRNAIRRSKSCKTTSFSTKYYNYETIYENEIS